MSSADTTYLYHNGHGDLGAEADNTGTSSATHSPTSFGEPDRF